MPSAKPRPISPTPRMRSAASSRRRVTIPATGPASPSLPQRAGSRPAPPRSRSPSRLLRLRNDILGLGLLQVTLAGLVLAGIAYLATGLSAGAALAIGLPLALSSTAQVLPSLRADGSINTRAGERAFSILLFQDLSIVPLITIIAALSRAPLDPNARPGWQMALLTILAIAGLVAA